MLYIHVNQSPSIKLVSLALKCVDPLSVEPSPPPFRRDSSLERGIIGAPPPLVRASDHLFTAAEVEALLAVRENEVPTRPP